MFAGIFSFGSGGRNFGPPPGWEKYDSDTYFLETIRCLLRWGGESMQAWRESTFWSLFQNSFSLVRIQKFARNVLLRRGVEGGERYACAGLSHRQSAEWRTKCDSDDYFPCGCCPTTRERLYPPTETLSLFLSQEAFSAKHKSRSRRSLPVDQCCYCRFVAHQI